MADQVRHDDFAKTARQSPGGFCYITNMYCPHCHSEIKDDATFCPHCGSDADTGWKEGAEFTDLETPDYDEILENEFGDDPDSPYAKKKNGFGGIVGTIAAVIVALAFIAVFVLH